MTLDHQLREADQIDAPGASDVAVGPDDSIYAVLRTPTPRGTRADLAAFAPTGEPRWQSPLSGIGLPRVFANADGPYVDDDTALLAFDAASGESRRLVAPGQRLLGTAQSGVFTQQWSSGVLTLRHLDSVGALVWERRLTSADPDFGVGGVAVTPEGGGVFFGGAESTVDFGDRTIEGPSGLRFNFVVEIDAAGATKWAFTHAGNHATHVALTQQGDILIAGRVGRVENGFDAFLAVATPAGVVRTHRIEGPGDQDVEDLAVSTDGIAWLKVSLADKADEFNAPDPLLRLGGQEFDEAAQYLFGIVP